MILALSAQPARRLPEVGVQHLDKLVHAGLYAVLSALVARALLGSRLRPIAAGVLAALLATGFGLIDELSQQLSPGREPSGLDLVADAVGAGIGALVAVRYTRRRHASHPSVR